MLYKLHSHFALSELTSIQSLNRVQFVKGTVHKTLSYWPSPWVKPVSRAAAGSLSKQNGDKLYAALTIKKLCDNCLCFVVVDITKTKSFRTPRVFYSKMLT